MRPISLFFVGLGILFGMLPFSFAQADLWQVAEVRNLRDPLALEAGQLQPAVISPDGSTLAWIDFPNVCLLKLSEATPSEDCHPLPAELDPSLTWAQDSQSLFAINAFGFESDLWQFDLTSQAFKNLTPDEFEGDTFILPEMINDYSPISQPTSNDLYFLRFDKLAQRDTLESWNSQTGLQTVYEFTGDIPSKLSFSPDGTRLAMMMKPSPDLAYGLTIFSPSTGEWMGHVAFDDLLMGVPPTLEFDFWSVDQISWAGEAGLVVQISNERLSLFNQQAIYVDLATLQRTPLVDFTGIASEDELSLRDEAGDVPSLRIPRGGAVTPDGSAFIALHYFTAETDYAQIWAHPLPPSTGEAYKVGDIYDFQPIADILPTSISQNGLMYIDGYVLVLEKP